jgi:GntR family transcriptional repressor for pyruvate dehydrogenase complex
MTVDATVKTDLEQNVTLLPETASERAVQFLRAMIFSGQLQPGAKLPPERDLSARLGISRMTLRLALKALESTGYIITTRGSRGGSRVSDGKVLYACWVRWMQDHSYELDDIFELLMTVETRLAALAAERRTQEDLAAMERATAREQIPQDWPSLFRTNMDIHSTIARAAHSPRLEQVTLQARSDLFMPVDLSQLERWKHKAHDTHKVIIAAIRDRDANMAAKQMAEHLRLIQELIDRAVELAGITPRQSLLPTKSGRRRR